jgi:alkanesulfonate monooxygenase
MRHLLQQEKLVAAIIPTIIGTCPAYNTNQTVDEYLQGIKTTMLCAEQNGWSSMLIFSDNSQIDPWIVANTLLSVTNRLTPLVALQPLYMHPFSAAKLIGSLSLLYDRPVNINFVSGGFPRDLVTFCDKHSHDERYERVSEYGAIMKHLLCEKRPLTFHGRYYNVESLQLPQWLLLKAHCIPMLTISGSSAAGLAMARKLGARAIQYLKPHTEYDAVGFSPDLQYGARVGIISRETSEEAWNIARKRYPADPEGAEVREYFQTISDSVWVKELGQVKRTPAGHPYWLDPYKNGQTSCPFLVGDKNTVAKELAGYMHMGLRTFLVENAADSEDATHITEALRLAGEKAQSYC